MIALPVHFSSSQTHVQGRIGQITSGKRVGAQNWKRPNRNKI